MLAFLVAFGKMCESASSSACRLACVNVHYSIYDYKGEWLQEVATD